MDIWCKSGSSGQTLSMCRNIEKEPEHTKQIIYVDVWRRLRLANATQKRDITSILYEFSEPFRAFGCSGTFASRLSYYYLSSCLIPVSLALHEHLLFKVDKKKKQFWYHGCGKGTANGHRPSGSHNFRTHTHKQRVFTKSFKMCHLHLFR